MPKQSNPCFRCTERSSTCRIDCKDWAEYVKERDERYEQQAKQNKAESDYIGYTVNLHERIEKRSRNKK